MVPLLQAGKHLTAGPSHCRIGHQVGYRRPTVHSRFRRGASGNPGGRPGGRTHGRVQGLILKEAYRQVSISEGGQVLTLPAIQVVLRSLIARAAKGNGPTRCTRTTPRGIPT